MKSVIGIAAFTFLLLEVLSLGYRWQNDSNQMLSAQAEPASAMPTPRGPIAPELVSETWLNSPALSNSDLRGKVVLIEFWTFG